MNMRVACGLLLWSCCVRLSVGGVLFDAEHDALRITGYPPELPCTPARLAIFDRAFGWDKVRYDPATGTYTISCHLVIGANDGTETYFQIGGAEHPDETLIMNKNIYVQPYWIEGENTEARWWYAPAKVNRLTIGSADNTNVHAVLKFAPDTTLLTGRSIEGKSGRGGQFFVYNSHVTALDPGKGFGIKNASQYMSLCQVGGDGHVFVNALISHARGNVCYGMDPGWRKEFRVDNTVFSDFGFISPSSANYLHCTFEGAREVAVRDSGGINAVFTDCVFTNNARNWELLYSDKGLVLVDSEWNIPRQGDFYRVRTNKNGKIQHPKLTVRRHIVVAVADGTGKPVKDAVVSFRAEQEGCDLIQSRTFKTDAQGQTPGRGQTNALALTDYIKTATDVPDQPAVLHLTYTLTAEKGGKTAAIGKIVPDQSWKMFKIVLE